MRVVRSMASRLATGPMGGGSGPVQRHEQRKLPVGKPKRAEGLVESAGQGAGCALHVEAEAMVPHKQRGCIRERIGT